MFAIGFIDAGGGYLADEVGENNGYGGRGGRCLFQTLEEAQKAAEKFCTGQWGCCTPAVQEMGVDGQWEKPYDRWVWSEHTPTLLFTRHGE